MLFLFFKVLTTSDNQALYQPHSTNVVTEKLQASISLSSNTSLAQEYSELEKKFDLVNDKVSLAEDQCDILRQEKEELQQKVYFNIFAKNIDRKYIN